MSTLDSLITSDLAALGEDSRRNLADVDDALSEKNMYRDDAPGAKARRDALADARRRELAMMPLVLSHVFAHRVARAAAGGAAVLMSLLAVVVLAEPSLFRYAVYVAPSLIEVANIEWALMMSVIMLLVVYLIALWIAQSWFARRMRDAVRTSDEPYRDLDALARGPLEVAQQAVRRVDGYALGGMLAGTTMLALVFGYAIVILDVLHDPLSWRFDGLLYEAALVKNVGNLVIALVLAGGIAFVVGREAHRTSGSKLLDMLGKRTTQFFIGIFVATTWYLAERTVDWIGRHYYLPSMGDRLMLAICVVLSLLGAAAVVLLWWRKRENRRIGD
jgi:hypothetical protein